MSLARSLKSSVTPETRKPAVPARHGAPEERCSSTLTRRDIAAALIHHCEGLSKREAKRLVDGVIEEMAATLSRGETLKLHEFGSFLVRSKGERHGRNPRTGAKVPIEPRKVVVFKASPNMKAAINGQATAKARTLLRITGNAEN